MTDDGSRERTPLSSRREAEDGFGGEDAAQKAKKTDARSSSLPEKRARHRPRDLKSAEAAAAAARRRRFRSPMVVR
jgi:hypothetical protein